MAETIRAESAHDVEKSEAIKEICEKATEPTEIWEELEARGIEATPGVVQQALQHTEPSPGSQHEQPPQAPSGLTTEDLEVIRRLAEKAGGVEELIRFLTLVERLHK
jgi:hypothetical protein